VDRNAFPGLSYYQLYDVDLEGNRTSHGIVSVETGIGPEIRVYPNPSDGEINLDLSGPAAVSDIRITNALGQNVPASWALTKENTLSVRPADKMEPGLYLLAIRLSGDEVLYKKLRILAK
jgi:hypothetical protein